MGAPLDARLAPPPPTTTNPDGTVPEPTHAVGPHGRIPGVPDVDVEAAADAEVTEAPTIVELVPPPPYQGSDGKWTTPKYHHGLGNIMPPLATPAPAAVRPRKNWMEDVDRIGLAGVEAAKKAAAVHNNINKEFTNEPRGEPAVDAPVGTPTEAEAEADAKIVDKYNPFSKGLGHGPVKTPWHWPGWPHASTPGVLPPVLAPPTAYPNGKNKPGFVEASVETGAAAAAAVDAAQATPAPVHMMRRAIPPAFKVHEEAAAAAALKAFAEKAKENESKDAAAAPLVSRQDGGASAESAGNDDHKKPPKIPGTHDTIPPWTEGSHTHTHHIPHSVGPGGKSTDPNGPGTGPMDAVVETEVEAEADIETRAKLEPREKPWPKHGGLGPANPPGHNGPANEFVEIETEPDAKPWPKNGGHDPVKPPNHNGPADEAVEARAVEDTNIVSGPRRWLRHRCQKAPEQPSWL